MESPAPSPPGDFRKKAGWCTFPVLTIFTVLLTENSTSLGRLLGLVPPFQSAHRMAICSVSQYRLWFSWLWGKHTHSCLTEDENEEQRSQRTCPKSQNVLQSQEPSTGRVIPKLRATTPCHRYISLWSLLTSQTVYLHRSPTWINVYICWHLRLLLMLVQLVSTCLWTITAWLKEEKKHLAKRVPGSCALKAEKCSLHWMIQSWFWFRAVSVTELK